MAKMSLYRHFEPKHGLILAVLDERHVTRGCGGLSGPGGGRIGGRPSEGRVC
ncbi:hypothetical protein ACTMU2_15065 [Cupriavidus basilensis]